MKIDAYFTPVGLVAGDLAGRGVDVSLAEPALPAERFESRAEAVGEGIEHGGVGPRS